MSKRLTFLSILGLLVAYSSGVCMADDAYTLTIKDHRFEPTEVRVPAGQKVRLVVRNLDSTPEEFESYELNREKVVAGGKEVAIFIGPLEPGRYKFFGEFHQDTAHGFVVAE
jgi:plastocyanin